MENGIKIGNELEKETANNLVHLFAELFKTAHDTHVEQETLRCAINAIGRITEINNITIDSCVITGDKTVNMDEV